MITSLNMVWKVTFKMGMEFVAYMARTRGESRLNVFENRVLKRIFGTEWDERYLHMGQKHGR